MKRHAIALALAAACAAFGAWAQDFSFDEDELFGSEEGLLEEVESASAQDALDSLLVSEGVVISGSFSGSLGATWAWNDPWSGFNVAAPDSYGLEPSAGLRLGMDARPSDELRVYGQVRMGWPFEQSVSVLTGPTTSTSIDQLNLSVFELFSDFNLGDKLFFRFGKQTVTWGVGYFFSPADVISLEPIDPLNPREQREGPLTLRAHWPIMGTQHNLWAYAVFDGPDMKPEDIALAAKAEFAVGAWELGAGGWLKRDRPQRMMLTAAGSVGQVSLFGEASLSHGSDRLWVDGIGMSGPVMLGDDSSWFFKGSAGFMWQQSDLKLTLAGQYLYDGEGYPDDKREELIDQAHAILDVLPPGPTYDQALGILKLLVAGSGRHYAALSASLAEFLHEDLSLSLFAMGNLSDWSGFARLGLGWSMFKGMSLDANATFAFGMDDSEYLVLNDGPAMRLGLSLNLGSGSF